MTTEEKNALAKEYAIKKYPYDPHAGAIAHQEILQYQRDAEREFLSIYQSRDKEVSDLVEALRNLYNADPHDGTWNRPAAMDAANRLLSKYPVKPSNT